MYFVQDCSVVRNLEVRTDLTLLHYRTGGSEWCIFRVRVDTARGKDNGQQNILSKWYAIVVVLVIVVVPGFVPGQRHRVPLGCSRVSSRDRWVCTTERDDYAASLDHTPTACSQVHKTHTTTNAQLATLRTSCGAVYCNQSCLYVCLCVFVGLSARFFSLHCALSLAAQCIVLGPVCLFMGLCVCGSITTITRNCVHRSSQNWAWRWI